MIVIIAAPEGVFWRVRDILARRRPAAAALARAAVTKTIAIPMPRGEAEGGTILSVRGLSKSFGEDVGRFYLDRYGIESACLRIGSSFPEPKDRRMLYTWLSYDDLTSLVRACLFAPKLGHTIVYGASVGLGRRFSASGWLPDVRRYGSTYFNYTGKPPTYILATPELADDPDNPLRVAFGNEGSGARPGRGAGPQARRAAGQAGAAAHRDHRADPFREFHYRRAPADDRTRAPCSR